jgi:hypothetical protein
MTQSNEFDQYGSPQVPLPPPMQPVGETPQPIYTYTPAYPYSAPPAYPYSAPPVTTGYPYAVAPTPVAKSRTGLTIGLTAVGLVVGLVVGAGAAALVLRRPASTPSTLAAGGTPPTAPTPSPSATSFSGDLRTLLLTAPRTSHPFAKPISKDGTLTADQIASTFTDPTTARVVLTEDGFVAGAIEQWHDADDTEVIIRLYQFGSPDEALSWSDFDQEGLASDTTLTDQSPIDGIDGSSCFVTKKVDSLGFIGTLGIATQKDIYMRIKVFQPVKQIRALAIKIMTSQYARLP